MEFNNVQVTNQVNYSLDAYVRLITQFSEQEINKIGKIFHVEKYDKIQKVFNDDSYFNGLDDGSPIFNRLLNIRDNGLFLRSPLMGDICEISKYLIDGVDITIRLSLHDNNFVFMTSQQNPDIMAEAAKKYSINLSDIKLFVRKIKPSDNAYMAFQKTIEPRNNTSLSLDYIFTSKTSRQFHIPSNVSEHIIDMPYANLIPEKIFMVFQDYDNFNTRDYKENGLFFYHI